VTIESLAHIQKSADIFMAGFLTISTEAAASSSSQESLA
jgi:hypothetical protein